MTEKVVRFADHERRSREPDAGPLRDRSSAVIIILPVVRIERHEDASPRRRRRSHPFYAEA